MKSQSAFEYLTTYVWVLVIIAAVLFGLYALGLFNQNALSPQHCIMRTDWSCINYEINSQGQLELTLTQSTGSAIEITGVACYQNQDYVGETSLMNPSVLNSGQSQKVGAYCYDSSGNVYTGSFGSNFNGYITVYYTRLNDNIQENASGTISVSVVTTNSLGNIGSLGYVPITLTNSQSSPTGTGFQQMISFNPSTYANYEKANLSNIEFTTGPDGSGTVLYAWIESGASSAASNTVAWINLGSSTVAANGGTLKIYMNFFSSDSPVQSGYTGYAPQLWCGSGCEQTSYGEYDNGASVFNYYTNFLGSTIPSGWNTAETSGLTVNDGITFTGASSGGFSAQIVLTTAYSRPFAMDEYADAFGSNPVVSLLYVNTYGSAFSDGYQSYQEYAGCCSGNYIYKRTNGGGGTIAGSSQSMPVTSNGISTFMAGNNHVLSMWDYGSEISAVDTTYNGYYPASGCWWNDKSVHVQWFRIRVYPPNGVMPSFSLGSAT